jgi:hypothetical protein
MVVRNVLLAWLLALLLVACGSGGDGSGDSGAGSASIPNRLLLWSSDGAPSAEAWASISMLPVYGKTPAESVARQAELPGRLMLWPNHPKANGFGEFEQYLDLASKDPRFEYVYVYDELFWTGTGDRIGWQEDEVIAASKLAAARNLKPLVVILPYTVLNPAFALKEPNAFAAIAINVYPSMVVSEDTRGCRYGSNLYSNLLWCSQAKLRQLGFRGEIWYVYQAFGMNTESEASLRARLQSQRETIGAAASMGVHGVVPFGLYLGSLELRNEPYLVPGKGSWFESLVGL